MSIPTRSSGPNAGDDGRAPRFPRLAVALLAGLAVALTSACGRASAPAGKAAPPPSDDAAPQEAPEAPASASEKTGMGGGAGAGAGASAPEPKDEEIDARLAVRLAKLDVLSERAIYALLETEGAATPRSPEPNVERVFGAAMRLRSHGDPIVRAGALALLGRMPRSGSWTEPFLSALSDPDPRVRREAVVGRTLQGVSEHWRSLLPLTTDPDDAVRAAVARAMGAVNAPEARAALSKLFADRSQVVVDSAAAALGSRIAGEPPAVVLDAVTSDRPGIRRAAALALAEAHTAECLAPLARLVDDPVWTVRSEAIRGLARFTGASAAEACVRIGKVAVDDHRPRTERFEALQALANTEKAPDRDALLAVATKDEDPALKLVAARTLLARADPRSCGALAALLQTEIGPRCDDEDKRFVRATAFATLQDAAGRALKDRTPATSRDVAGWHRLLPEIEARVRASDFSYAPAYLRECW